MGNWASQLTFISRNPQANESQLPNSGNENIALGLFASNQTYFGPRFVIEDQAHSNEQGITSRAFWEEIIGVLGRGVTNIDELSGFENIVAQVTFTL